MSSVWELNSAIRGGHARHGREKGKNLVSFLCITHLLHLVLNYSQKPQHRGWVVFSFVKLHHEILDGEEGEREENAKRGKRRKEEILL